jgi:hypothetical protein
VPSISSANILDIGNLIYATGLNGSGTTLSTGNVGIGTTTPTYKLTVVGDMSVTGTLRVGNGADPGTSGYILRSNGSSAAPTWVATSSLGFASSSGSNNYIQNQNATDQSANFRISGTGSMGTTTIGTATPEFKLTMAGDGGIIAKGTYGSGTSLATTGAGTRMIWYPQKAAFRAGYVSGVQWNDGNIGTYSAAFGRNNTASSSDSFAAGEGNIVSEGASIAMGTTNVAGGYASIALGGMNSVTTNYSVALGYGNLVSGSGNSHAYGNSSISNGQNSIAFGNYVTSSNYMSMALGYQMEVSGGYSFGLNVSDIPYTLEQASTIALMGGNVGINTTTPVYKLTVAGDMSVTGTIRVGNSADPGTGGFILMSNGSSLAPTWTNTSSLGLAAGTGSLGHVAFWSGTSTLSYDSGDFYWDTVYRRLGVGTSTPRETLDVAGKIAINGIPFIFVPNQSTFWGTMYVGPDAAGGGGSALEAGAVGNVYVGKGAGWNNTSGDSNTGIGQGVMYSNTTGQFNTAIGLDSLQFNTTGNGNTALGEDSLNSNVNGGRNTALGLSTMRITTSSSGNVAVGFGALYSDFASSNTAVGFEALTYNSTGALNVAVGYRALYSNTTSFANTAVGFQALRVNTGASNTAFGYGAGDTLTTGNLNVIIGSEADVDATVSESIVIGAGASVSLSNRAVIGTRDLVSSTIHGGIYLPELNVAGSGVAVLCYSSSTDQVYYNYTTACLNSSDERLKINIEDMTSRIDVIKSLLKLRGIYFNWDPDNPVVSNYGSDKQIGVIAQEVMEVLPELVSQNPVDGYYSVDYSKLTAFLIEVAKVQQVMLDSLFNAITINNTSSTIAFNVSKLSFSTTTIFES